MARRRRSGPRITVPIAAVYGNGAEAEAAFAQAKAAGANPAALACVALAMRRFRRRALAGGMDERAWRRWTGMWRDEISGWRFTDDDGNEVSL